MKISNSNRLLKLIKNLVVNPRLIYPYLTMSVFSRRSPLDMCMPWWSFLAIQRADQLMSGKRVFEYGSGGSTLRYAKMAISIVSVEDDENWKRRVEKRLHQKGIENVVIILRLFDFKNPVSFEVSEYISAVDGVDWDVVIIDGQDWSFQERISCFRRVEPRMKPGSLIILDDFWRYEELLDSNRSKSFEVYESVGPARIGVTSTGFFFY